MISFTKIFHNLAMMTAFKGNRDFLKSCKSVEDTQKKILFKKFGYKSYIDFKENKPVVIYNDIKEKIEKLRTEQKIYKKKQIVRFEPTSGSTSKVKWIPYTKEFISEIDFSVSPLLYDLYKTHPFIKEGKHFWSLSWLPKHMRNDQQTDDSKLLSPVKRIFMKNILCMDQEDVLTDTIHEAKKATALKLLTENISLISVWSPTYFLEIIYFIIDNKLELKEEIFDKKIKLKLNSVIKPEDLTALFNKKVLFNSWGQGSSKKWLRVVKTLFPNFVFVEKGIWSTEAILTIPYQGKFPLAINSHFFEFLDTQKNEIVPSWEVTKGRLYQPIVTTSSGLFRYHIEDNLLCDDFFQATPCFKFLGRDKHSDMVGEKLSQESVERISAIFESRFEDRVISLVANNDVKNRPRYDVYIQGLEKMEALNFFEEELNKHFHYNLAREKGQLDPCRIIYNEDALNLYYNKRKQDGLIEGNIKIEPITVLMD